MLPFDDVIMNFETMLLFRRMIKGKTQTLRTEAHIWIANGWNSLKYNQNLVKFLISINFLCKICDIVDMKHHKMVVLSRMWVKRPPIGAKHPNSTKYSEIFFMWYHYQVIVRLDIEVADDICQLLTLCIRRNEYFCFASERFVVLLQSTSWCVHSSFCCCWCCCFVLSLLWVGVGVGAAEGVTSSPFVHFSVNEFSALNSLHWRHNGRDGVSNHQPDDCLLNRLFMRRSKKHQSSASPAFVRGIHRWSVNSPHKFPVTRKCFHLLTSSCYF